MKSFIDFADKFWFQENGTLEKSVGVYRHRTSFMTLFEIHQNKTQRYLFYYSYCVFEEL